MINWNEIDTKGNKSGNIKTLCPVCSHTRKKKKDPCLSVNLDKGLAKCWNCEEISVKDIKEPKKQTVLPPQDWQNYTKLSDKMVKYMNEERGIRQETIIACKVTQEEKYFPQIQKKRQAIVFNYFEGSTLVNKKYKDAEKNFTQEKDAKKIFYGINDIVGKTECFIVEGEMDKLAMYEAGFKNCISVPNGANDLNDIFDTCETYLNAIETFIIGVDMDAPGIKLEQEIIKRLGKHKCKRIHWKGKDANDDLLSGYLKESVEKAEYYPVEGTFTAYDISDELNDFYENGFENPLVPHGEEFIEINKCFSVLRGQLTVVTGIPTHGKSNWLEWYLLNLINDNGLKLSLFSPEHLPMKLHHSVLAEKVIGKPFHKDLYQSKRMTLHDLQMYKEWSNERVYLTSPEVGQSPTWKWLLDTFKQQIFRYGVDMFVIDAFNKVKRKNTDSLGEINDILAELTLFCQQYNVNVFLIAHPTKMRKKDDNKTFHVPTLYDVKGSGDFYDQTHNGLTVYRDFDLKETIIIPQKLKFKHQGQVGTEVFYNYQIQNGRYKPVNQKENNQSIIIEKAPF